jgi:hypothetical protein
LLPCEDGLAPVAGGGGALEPSFIPSGTIKSLCKLRV